LVWLAARRHLEERPARLSLWLLALAPAAAFFSYPYSESLFLLLSAASLLLLETGRWQVATLAGAAAALTRAPGALLGLSFAAAAWRPQQRRLAMGATGPLLGLAGVAALDWTQYGDPLGFWKSQSLWIGPARNPLFPIGTIGTAILQGDPFRPEALGLPVLVAFAAGSVWVALRMPPAYAAYSGCW
jgi:hypothetical protein